MTRVPKPGPAAQPHGPFDTEADTRPLTRPIFEAFDADPGAGKMAPHSRRLLGQALEAAGVRMGLFDNRIAEWLCEWEPATVVVVAGWVTRARQAAGLVIPHGFELTVLQLIRDGVAYAEERGGEAGREQAGLYRALARALGMAEPPASREPGQGDAT